MVGGLQCSNKLCKPNITTIFSKHQITEQMAARLKAMSRQPPQVHPQRGVEKNTSIKMTKQKAVVPGKFLSISCPVPILTKPSGQTPSGGSQMQGLDLLPGGSYEESGEQYGETKEGRNVMMVVVNE
jgi:hypothetical protein